MKAFEMILPTSLDQALDALGAKRGVQVLAGGQDLIGTMQDHLVEPDVVVNLKSVPGLDKLERTADGGLELGALVRLVQLERAPEVVQHFPMLAQAAGSVGSPQIRSQATLGGNLCQRPRCPYFRNELAMCLRKGGDECFAEVGISRTNAILGGGPSYIVHPSDCAPALVALDASVHLADKGATRSMPLQEFFVLPKKNAKSENVLEPGEIVTGVTVPSTTLGWRSIYLKAREREAFDFALSAVALAVRLEGSKIAEVRLVLGGVAPTPWRCTSTEKLLIGRDLSDETAIMAGKDALKRARPLEHNAFKIPMTQGLLRKAFRQLA